jgi:O-antigen/teichoic acid export membrane protein
MTESTPNIPEHRHSHGTRILRVALSGFVVNIFAYGFLFIGQGIIIPRILSRPDYAEYTVSISFVAILALFADLGMNPMFTRMFAEAEEKAISGHMDRRGFLLGSALAIRIATSILVAIAVIFLAPQIYAPVIAHCATILLLNLLISSRILIIRSVGESLLRGHGKYYLAASFALLDAMVFAGLLLYGASRQLTLTEVIWIYTLSNVPGFLLTAGVVYLWVRREHVRLGIDLQLCRTMLRMAIPLSLGTAFLTIHNEADKLLLDKLSTPFEVSGYGATIRLLSAASPLPLVLAAVTAPEVTRLLMRNDVERTRRLTGLALRLLLTIAGAIALLVTVAHHDMVVLLLSAKYASASPLLTISAWMLLPIFLAWYTCEMSIAAGEFRPQTIYTGLIMIFVIAGDFVLIPSYGAAGAMTSKLTAIVLGCSILVYLQRKAEYLDMKQAVSSFLRILLSVVVALAVFAILHTFDWNAWIESSLLLIVYFIMIHITRVISFRDTLGFAKQMRGNQKLEV